MTNATRTDSDARTASWSTGPVRWDNVENDTLGTSTFQKVLYNPTQLDAKMPVNYRTQKTRDGTPASHVTSSYAERLPSVETVAELLAITNKRRSDIDSETAGSPRECVAVIPEPDSMESHRDEFEAGSRSFEPAFNRVPFFDERIVGNHGLSAAYGLVINDARFSDDPDYDYDWNANYNTGAVTITVEKLTA
ncbi:hypothetical protein [Salinibaculum rarum]|uniref:hypothetical protein n=1 Tax=Salinibaculum rarum TaxID=3058903 RepID=UPI00266047A2|nr:hypothetical protein [Salinibaculum sp. KK48]